MTQMLLLSRDLFIDHLVLTLGFCAWSIIEVNHQTTQNISSPKEFGS